MSERLTRGTDLCPALGEGLRRTFEACGSDAVTDRIQRLAEALEGALQRRVSQGQTQGSASHPRGD